MSATTAPTRLALHGIGKSYATPVLVDVELQLYAGEVHALIGANGAGKSTLARIISGVTEPDTGLMQLDGQLYRPADKAAAERAGVHIVQQELNLIETLSVAENLFLNRMPRRGGFVRFTRLYEQARQALSLVDLDDVDPRMPVSRLGVGHQQLVEIAAALSHRCRVLILDEPTAALTAPQVDRLFDNVARLKASGVGLIYVSHRLEEIRRIADRATILRDGRVVTTMDVDRLSLDEAVQWMVGKEVLRETGQHAGRPGDIALRVTGLCSGPRVRHVSFEVRQGELLGIAGLVGSGRTELLRAIFGAERAESGTVEVMGGAAAQRFRSPRDAVLAGLAMVPEDRKQDGLLLTQSVLANTSLGQLANMSRPWGWVHERRERRAAEELARTTELQYRSLDQPVNELSGGNQQKVLMARWLLQDARVLLFDEPTRGIDVSAKATVYRLLHELTARGKALVVVSSELEELLAICDRIVVLAQGRLVGAFTRGDWSQERILAAAIGGA